MVEVNCLFVFVETFSALLAQPTSVHHLTEKDTGAILGIARFFVKDLHYRETGIQANAMRYGKSLSANVRGRNRGILTNRLFG